MPLSVPRLWLAVLLLAAAAAATASAQENTTTTTTTTVNYENVTVTVPPLPTITPAIRPEATVTVDFNGTHVVLRYVCFYYSSPDKCPELLVRILANDTVVKEFGYRVNTSSDCSSNICRYYITAGLDARYSRVVVEYSLRHSDNSTRTYRIVLTAPGEGADIYRLLSASILIAVFAGMVLHENPYAVGLGAFMVPLVLYLLSRAGLVHLDFFVVNAAIILSVVLFYITRGR